MKKTSLRKSGLGQSVWTKDELRAGFTEFRKLHSRYPTAHEIDAFPYLPSARSIQRTFGGLVNIRKELFPKEISNYTKGSHRSGVAKKTFANGRTLEKAFYEYLVGKFEEIAIHEHKLIRPGDVSSDFYIYLNSTDGIVIDIFYADSLLNLINVVNIKLRRYSLITPPTYLVVVGNPLITQEEIATKVANRKVPLPSHISITSESYFKQSVIPDLRKQSEYSK
jgi:hypothetical protein